MICRLTIYATLIVYLFSCCRVRCDSIKIWNLDSNRHEANSWLWSDKLCPQDRIIYPDQAIVYVNKLIPNQQIILPNNGEIVLDDNFDLSQNVDTQSDCQPIDRRYKLISGEWFDPMVWNQTLSGHIINGNWANNPIPHVDRIPCIKDRVVFPKGSSYQVTINSQAYSLKVKSIEINGITLDNQEFQSFISSNTGRYLFVFHDPQSLSIAPSDANDCDTGNGCPCEYRENLFINRICKGVKCKPVNCVNPIKPEGHCCQLCGALIRLTGISKAVDLSRFQDHFINFWSSKYSGTLGYASRNRGDILEVVITELESSGLASRCAQHLFEDLSEDNNQFGLNYKSIELTISNAINSGLSSFTTVLITTIFIILLIVGFVMYRRRFGVTLTSLWNGSAFANSQFTFIRFQGLDESERVGLELGLQSSQPRSEQVTTTSTTSRSSIPKSTFALFSISEEKVSIAEEGNENPREIVNQVELETDLEPRSTHDKALLLDVVSLDQD